jgi:hypothetical protein
MPTYRKPDAETFCNAFVDWYTRIRAAFSDERWKEIWSIHANVVLWQPTERYRPPEEIERGVLAETARELNLFYRNGEPLRLDAVFSTRERWFPISVAIEHEYSWSGFTAEIDKLLSVRCPLKVGITYVYGRRAKQESNMQRIEEWIKSSYSMVLATIEEDETTEYLFLIAAEAEEEREVVWYALHFNAAEGPEKKTFRLMSPERCTA